MPVNISILGLQEDAAPTSSSLSSSSKSKTVTSSLSYSSPRADEEVFLQSLRSTSPSPDRPRTATSITIRAPSPNLRSSSPPPSSRSPTIFSLSPRPLSPRQHRCPACSELFYSAQAIDEHHCRSKRNFSSSTSPTAPRPLHATINTSSSVPLDFDISISNVSSSPAPATSPVSDLPAPSYSSSHSEHMYYRKLSDLNAECQRLQAQRDHLIDAHQQHMAQQSSQWSAALSEVKDKLRELERSSKRKEDGWTEERRKLMDKVEEGQRTVKTQREDLLRLIDQYEQARASVDQWKKEKRELEDDVLLLKREKREIAADRDRVLRVAEEEKQEMAKQVKLWTGVARKAEEEVVRVRADYEAKESERRKREERMREELLRVLNELQAKEKQWRDLEKEREREQQVRDEQQRKREDEVDRTIATLRLSWEQEKSQALAIERELTKTREEHRIKEERAASVRHQEREDTKDREERDRRERDGLKARVTALEEEKERLESMVEGSISKLEGALREKTERDAAEDRERKEWHERVVAMEKDGERADDEWKHRLAAKESQLDEERRAMRDRVEQEKAEKREVLLRMEDLRRGREEERAAKEEALRALEDARSIMQDWRVSREAEESLRQRDKQARRERKARLLDQERELERIRQSVRGREGWSVEVSSPVNRDGWEEKVEISGLSVEGADLYDVDVDIDDGMAGHQMSHLTLSPGQSMRLESDADRVNIRV